MEPAVLQPFACVSYVILCRRAHTASVIVHTQICCVLQFELAIGLFSDGNDWSWQLLRVAQTFHYWLWMSHLNSLPESGGWGLVFTHCCPHFCLKLHTEYSGFSEQRKPLQPICLAAEFQLESKLSLCLSSGNHSLGWSDWQAHCPQHKHREVPSLQQ